MGCAVARKPSEPSRARVVGHCSGRGVPSGHMPVRFVFCSWSRDVGASLGWGQGVPCLSTYLAAVAGND